MTISWGFLGGFWSTAFGVFLLQSFGINHVITVRVCCGICHHLLSRDVEQPLSLHGFWGCMTVCEWLAVLWTFHSTLVFKLAWSFLWADRSSPPPPPPPPQFPIHLCPAAPMALLCLKSSQEVRSSPILLALDPYALSLTKETWFAFWPFFSLFFYTHIHHWSSVLRSADVSPPFTQVLTSGTIHCN